MQTRFGVCASQIKRECRLLLRLVSVWCVPYLILRAREGTEEQCHANRTGQPYLEEPFPRVGLGILSYSQFIYILHVGEMNSLLIITIENE